MSQWGTLKLATVDCCYPANPLRGAPWVAAIALGKTVGTVPSDPSTLRENWLKVSMYMDSWAVVNGFGKSVMGIRKVGLEGDKEV